MEAILEFLRTDLFILILTAVNVILIISFIANMVTVSKIKGKYNTFMRKLGNGNDLESMIKLYIDKVDDVSAQNKEVIDYCKKLDYSMSNCIQKVGTVRYNAFRDTGSDLSFAVALLDNKNDGIVLNGIYSREMSNIYAKTVENGTSKYALSEEEQEAINKAMNMEKLL